MKKSILALILVISYCMVGYSQFSIKIGYGEDHASQISGFESVVDEKFVLVEYGLSSRLSVGLGFRKIDDVLASKGSSFITSSGGNLMGAVENTDVASSEIFGVLSGHLKNLNISFGLGYSIYSFDSQLVIEHVRFSNVLVYSSTHNKVYENVGIFRAGLDVSYDFRLFDKLYIVPYGRYHHDIRGQTIPANLISMEPIDEYFTDVPEIVAFNTSSKSFFVRRAYIIFGLSLKYEL